MAKHARGRQRDTSLTYLGKFTNKPPMDLLLFSKGQSCVQNNNQRLYEDMILIDDDSKLYSHKKFHTNLQSPITMFNTQMAVSYRL